MIFSKEPFHLLCGDNAPCDLLSTWPGGSRKKEVRCRPAFSVRSVLLHQQDPNWLPTLSLPAPQKPKLNPVLIAMLLRVAAQLMGPSCHMAPLVLVAGRTRTGVRAMALPPQRILGLDTAPARELERRSPTKSAPCKALTPRRPLPLPCCGFQKQFNKVVGAIRAMAEEANADLKTRFKALRHVSLDPWRIGAVVAAAPALFHFEKSRTA